MKASLVHDVGAERSVLGAMLIDNEAVPVALDLLTADDFSLPVHSQIFASMARMHETGEPIDEITVAACLARQGNKLCAPVSFLSELSARVASSANVGHWARIVREQAVARRIVVAADAVRRAALSSDIDGSIAKLAEIENLAMQRHDLASPAGSWLGAEPGPGPGPGLGYLSGRGSWPRLSEAGLHGVAGDYVRALEPHTEADPVAVLIQLLVAFGNVIGRGPHFVAEADRHYTNEFVVLVGNTAKGRKGSSWGHVRRLCELVDEQWCRERIRSGLSSGEGLVHAVRDPSSEASADAAENEDSRLLVLEGEFASALAVAAREGNTLSAVVRNAWDGTALGNLTKNNPDQATGAHISVIGHITQDELHRRLGAVEVGNGFANRFLWVCVKRSKCLPEGGAFGDAAVRPFVARLRRAVEYARTVKQMHRDGPTRELWLSAYARLSAPRLGLLDAVTCRSEPHVMRLSCLYALLDCSDVVRLEHLQAALALWQYAESSCLCVFGQRSGDPVADVILEALREKPEGMTRTEISALFGRNKRANVLRAALTSLAHSGLVTAERAKTGGAPRELWRALIPGDEDAPVAVEARQRDDGDGSHHDAADPAGTDSTQRAAGPHSAAARGVRGMTGPLESAELAGRLAARKAHEGPHDADALVPSAPGATGGAGPLPGMPENGGNGRRGGIHVAH